MSPPNKVYSPYPGVVYDEERGVCRAADAFDALASSSVPESPSEPVLDRSRLSLSTVYVEAFGPRSRPARASLWSHSPLEFTGWRAASVAPFSLTACGTDPDVEPTLGDPIASVTALGTEQIMNAAPLGNVDGFGLGSEAGNRSAVAWSSHGSSTAANNGTFAFLRSGETGGNLVTVSSDVSSLHLGTTVTTLPNDESVVMYARVTGDEEPSSLVAQRLSPTGAPVGSEISILAEDIRDEAPFGQIIPLGDGFLVVYRDGENLGAKQYGAAGNLLGERDLGPATSSTFALASGEGNRWALAEISSTTQIRIRSFAGTTPSGSPATFTSANIPAEADIALAMQDDGSMMVAWNTVDGSDQRIDGAYLGPAGQVTEGPFVVRRSGLANTLALAGDHRGNYVFAWEEGGRINSYIFNGTTSPESPADFSHISDGTQNSNILVSVSPEGVISFVYDKASSASGDVTHNITRRDYRIAYE